MNKPVFWAIHFEILEKKTLDIYETYNFGSVIIRHIRTVHEGVGAHTCKVCYTTLNATDLAIFFYFFLHTPAPAVHTLLLLLHTLLRFLPNGFMANFSHGLVNFSTLYWS